MNAKNGTATKDAKIDVLDPVSNGGETDIILTEPYICTIRIQGVANLLFHGWNNEAVEEKAKAAKGSDAKKSDNVESYVYRIRETNEIGLPGEYLRMSLINAAKYRQDPRSPRKSAMDLYKAGLIPLTELASLGSTEWDFLDQRRVTVQRSAITRSRPAFLTGWEAEFQFQVQLPEYITPAALQSVLVDAGRLVGVGDFRPTYGRFTTTNFKVEDLA